MTMSAEGKRIHDLSKKFTELLAEADEELGVLTLANVVALWLAGHQGPDAEAYRKEALEMFVEQVQRLTAINDRMIQDAIKMRREMRERRKH